MAPTASEDETSTPEREGTDTKISEDALAHIGEVHTNIPESFTPHPKLKSLLEKRAKMAREGGIDWGFAEIAAFGSLLMEGTEVRLAGQDSRRGTFVQRHAVFHDRVNGDEWYPLKNLTEDQARFFIYDSLLSSTGHWASSTAIRWRIRMRWCSGRPSSATSSTAPRSSLTSS